MQLLYFEQVTLTISKLWPKFQSAIYFVWRGYFSTKWERHLTSQPLQYYEIWNLCDTSVTYDWLDQAGVISQSTFRKYLNEPISQAYSLVTSRFENIFLMVPRRWPALWWSTDNVVLKWALPTIIEALIM